jgi:hypothetical protein
MFHEDVTSFARDAIIHGHNESNIVDWDGKVESIVGTLVSICLIQPFRSVNVGLFVGRKFLVNYAIPTRR